MHGYARKTVHMQVIDIVNMHRLSKIILAKPLKMLICSFTPYGGRNPCIWHTGFLPPIGEPLVIENNIIETKKR